MIYRIYPPIGIARVGNSPGEFFIGRETPDSIGTEVLGDGTEVPVRKFKDSAFRLKRQAARFRIFEFDDTGSPGRPASLPAGSEVRWTVTLANKKDAVMRTSLPITESDNQTPPPLPQLDPTRANRAIAAQGVAPAAHQPAVALRGTYLTATPFEEAVFLGELQTQKDGHLLVLGGHGISRSPEGKPIGEEFLNGEPGGGFYNNRGWYDDVSDGPVSAEIRVPGAQPAIAVEPAWVIVAPPDFAPATPPVVTLYDVLAQVAIDRGDLALPAKPSFSRDIWPMLRRAAGLAWVNRDPNTQAATYWERFSTDWIALSDPSRAAAPLRQANARLLREIRSRRALANFSLRRWQQQYLAAWEQGDFINDFDGTIPGAGVLSPENLTRTALDATAGQGFFPGIEAAILVMNPSLYSAPFRIASHVRPGTLTALMALPWQADFLKCEGNWWPSQRPDSAAQEADPNAILAWIRPIEEDGHRDLVTHVGKLGVVVLRQTNGRDVFVEVDRDPAVDDS
jgi:hypothetical protein